MSAVVVALTTVGAGLILGLRHATDADHIVVVTAMVQREPRMRTALRTAVVWGLGHSLTFLGLGAAIVLLGVHPPASVDTAIELVVAAMMIGLGLWHLRSRPRFTGVARRVSGLRPFFIGVIHGLAGSAAIALLALTTITSVAGALGYLLAFALGVTLGMAIFTMLIAAPLTWTTRRVVVDRALTVVASLASIGVGAMIAVDATAGW